MCIALQGVEYYLCCDRARPPAWFPRKIRETVMTWLPRDIMPVGRVPVYYFDLLCFPLSDRHSDRKTEFPAFRSPSAKQKNMLPRSIPRSLCRLCLSEIQTCRARYSLRPPRFRSIHVTHRVAATPPPMVNVRWDGFGRTLKIWQYRSGWRSDISMEKYHQLSDVTMDTLLERLEDLLDEIGESDYEVEYQVRIMTFSFENACIYERH